MRVARGDEAPGEVGASMFLPSMPARRPLRSSNRPPLPSPAPQEHAVKEAEAAAAAPPKGGKGKETLSNTDLARLIVVKPVRQRR